MSGGKAVVVGFVGLLFSGCVAPFPPPAAGGSSDDGGTQSTGPTPSTTLGDTTVGATEGTASGSEGSGSTGLASTDSSSGEPPLCRNEDDCGPNQSCIEGSCADACGGAWGEGNYGSCLDELGGVVPETLCGAPDQHRCILYGDPIESTHCAAQHCATACDCPAPPASGDATVTCGNITFPDRDIDCYLSCSAGETCPDGMTCRNGAVCVTEVADVPMYGNCGNLASNCADDGVCYMQNGRAVCITPCENNGDCDPAPAGAREAAECGNIGPPPGSECILPCNNDGDCPPAMECYADQLCMWPI